MDYFPSREDLMKGLNAWMKRKPKPDVKNDIYPHYQDRCAALGIKPVKYEQLIKILGDTTHDLKYSQIKALLEALKIEHWPQFLDLCCPPSIESDVIPIGPDNCEKRTIDSATVPKTPIQIYCANPDTLKRIRTRIDVVEMKKGQSTEFAPYYGHEYVHVITGRIVCRFNDKPIGKPKVFTLVGSREPGRNPNDFFAIAFAAGLHHSFKCLTDVHMAVGRSAKSLPKGIR